MKKYYYSDGTNSFGPYTREELQGKYINKETKVWYEGIEDWQRADSIPELMGIFGAAPPAITPASRSGGSALAEEGQKPPKSWLAESIVATILCCMPFGVAGIVNASRVETKFYAGDIEGANRAAAQAQKWTMISFWIGIVVLIIYFIMIIVDVPIPS